MGIIGYDPSKREGFGSIFLPQQSGLSDFILIDAIADDITDSSINADLEKAIYFGLVYPFVKVTSGFQNKSFVSVPEARYKMGTISYAPLAEITFNEDETFTSKLIPYHSEYLVYDYQAFEPARFIIQYPNPSIVDYGMVFGVSTDSNTDVFFIDTRTFVPGYVNLQSACGLQFNFMQDIIADIKLFYSLNTVAVDFYGDVRDVQPFYL